MIKQVYEKLVRKKFFNKVFIAYSLIIIITVYLLTFIISTNISSILEVQSLSFNKQILQIANQSFETTCSNAKQIHQQIISEESFHNDAIFLLMYKSDPFEDYYLSKRKNFETSLFAKANHDKAINHIYLFNLIDNIYSPYSTRVISQENSPYISTIMESAIHNSMPSKSNKRLYFYPSININVSDKNPYYTFAIYDYIRDVNDASNILGSIIYDYDSDSLRESYAQYEQYLKGHILILTEKGEVIFDSSGYYYDKPFPMFEQVKDTQNGISYYNGGMLNVIRNDLYDFITVGMIPYSDLYEDINSLKKKIYIISYISLIFILVITFIGTKAFSKRIKVVINAIRRIQKGDFLTSITQTGEDEIGEISENLNQMCVKLNSYIEKEYIANIYIKDAELKQREAELKLKETELRQKTAELYALQTQINPHFLYNTLEVIRMKALSTKEGEVGRMIQILATMFRNSIKNEMVVYIKDELELCKSYLELYNIRFSESLTFEFDIDPAILDYGIIKHLLQPIIENSIIHGIDLDQEGNMIKLKGWQTAEAVYISVSDNGFGISEEKLHQIIENLNGSYLNTKDSIGLTNVNYRIKLLFGNDYGITIWSRRGIGTQITVKIAPKTREELKQDVQSIDR